MNALLNTSGNVSDSLFAVYAPLENPAIAVFSVSRS